MLLTLDAAGLSQFAVTGAAKALDFAMNPQSAVLMGVLRLGTILGHWNLPRAT